jgi:N-acetyl-gamma-glutamyl-phosphate reductase common form
MTHSSRIKVLIAGGSGYGAGELLRLLLKHPYVEVVSATSRTHAGSPLSSVHTHLLGSTELTFDPAISFERLEPSDESLLFLALPQGMSATTVVELRSKGLPENLRIIDLSGDLRIKDAAIHTATYPDVPLEPALRNSFVYGIPELGVAPIHAARFISNPGCLATAATLTLLPFVHGDLSLVGSTVIDAKTGTSGAGREPQSSMHHPTRTSDFTAYKVLAHRHEPEILQALGDPRGDEIKLMFVPHLIPVSRGIFVTTYVTLDAPMTYEALYERFDSFYHKAPFVRLRSTPPRLVDVVGSNFCDLSLSVRGNQVVIMAALDNLVKGMAGQAVQNLNNMYGFDERCGLEATALGPV